MYIDDEYDNNISWILRENPFAVNDSVTAKIVEGMLYLDTNSRNYPQLKRHKKEPMLIENENKKTKERLKLC